MSDDLVGMVRETMLPSHVSLWLRPETGYKSKRVDKAMLVTTFSPAAIWSSKCILRLERAVFSVADEVGG